MDSLVALAFFDGEIVVHIILFNLGVEAAIWTIGILILTADKFSLKGLLNPPVIAVFVALIIQATGGKLLGAGGGGFFIFFVEEKLQKCI